MDTNPHPWMQMASGRPWPMLTPSAADVHWPDIAEHLAKTNRFQGGTPNIVYSVAQHCVLATDLAPMELKPYALLHDAHEGITGDQVSPLKEALAILGGAVALRKLEHITNKALFAAAGLKWPMPKEIAREVKAIDLRLLATEKRDLMADPQKDWIELPPPFPTSIRPWPWVRAADEWMDRFRVFVAGSTKRRNG